MIFSTFDQFLKCIELRTTPFEQYFLGTSLRTTPFEQYFLGIGLFRNFKKVR
jgi:hypothetical protein